MICDWVGKGAGTGVGGTAVVGSGIENPTGSSNRVIKVRTASGAVAKLPGGGGGPGVKSVKDKGRQVRARGQRDGEEEAVGLMSTGELVDDGEGGLEPGKLEWGDKTRAVEVNTSKLGVRRKESANGLMEVRVEQTVRAIGIESSWKETKRREQTKGR